MYVAELDKYIDFITKLAEGINPITHAKCKDGEVLRHPDVIVSLFKLSNALKEIYDEVDLNYEIRRDEYGKAIYESYDFEDIRRTISFIKNGGKSDYPIITNELCLDDYGYGDKQYFSGSGNLYVDCVATYKNVIMNTVYDRPECDNRRFKISYRKVLDRGDGLCKEIKYLQSYNIAKDYMPQDLTSEESKKKAEKLVEILGERDRCKYIFEEIIVNKRYIL